MRDKYGFKTYGNNGLENYSNSKVVANAHRYVPNHKKATTTQNVSDLFKDNRTQSQKREDKLKEELRSIQNRKVSKDMLMSSEELEFLSNASKLSFLFNQNRYAFVSSLDNAQCKEIERKYSNIGEYFTNMNNESVHINKVSKIEKLDYVPSSVLKKSNYMLKHTTYDIYVKHEYSNENVLVARVVFAN